MEETEDELHGVLLLVGPGGGNVAYVAELEVAEADLALLGAFSDALGRAADPRPGLGYKPLAEALAKIGRECDYQWVPDGDAATIADWARRALSPVLCSPFEGPHGAANHELLSGLLRVAGDWENYIEVDQDDEAAVGRVAVSMLRSATGSERRRRSDGRRSAGGYEMDRGERPPDRPSPVPVSRCQDRRALRQRRSATYTFSPSMRGASAGPLI
ncbi:hypothetical protein AB0L71_10205 [Streptomyces sp. NPDC052052]|uniref:hypothetical protein n=1 Tax=Streptomyces sp. NPDC052052 TaxID=3154756 RepID=UPI00341B4319